MNQPTKYDLNPDRLLPPDPTERAIARDLYDSVKDLPIISPHGHVPVEWFHDKDYHFSDPTSLFITPDHYVTRVMHSQGVALKDLGVNQKNFTPEQARNAFLIWGRNWGAYAGTPMRYWFEDSLQNVFDIHTKFGEDTAGRIYDELNDLLKQPEFSTRELVKKFNIGFISTTDDTLDDLHLHDETNADPDFPARLAPAFRPDVYLEPSTPGWAELVGKLGDVAGVDTSTYEGFTAAIKSRRRAVRPLPRRRAHRPPLRQRSHQAVCAGAGRHHLDRGRHPPAPPLLLRSGAHGTGGRPGDDRAPACASFL